MVALAFTKMHGTGNDFIVLDDRNDTIDLSANAVVALCDRRFGVGADGVIRIGASYAGDAFMDYRNANGSVSEMCGNGVRVVAKYLGDRQVFDTDLALDTRDGIKQITVTRSNGLVELVTVDMGKVVLEGDQRLDDVGVTVALANTGNPHAVVVTDEDLDSFPLSSIGPLIEQNSLFPNGRNVPVVQAVPGGFRQRTWERGCGETLACGTAATGSFGVLQNKGLVADSAIVELRGGRLEMRQAASGNVLMTGPAEETFSGTVDADFYGIR